MILTCPDCATSYFVDDDRIPAAGRTVKCSSCGVRWRFVPPPSESETSDLSPPEAAEPGPSPSAEAPAAETSVAVEPLPVAEIKHPRKPIPRKLLAGLFAGAVLIVTLAGLVMFRQPLANAMPAVGPAYEAVGLKVDTLGLKIEEVSFDTTFEAGRPVLMIKGVVHNIRKEPRVAPPITVRLLDADEVLIGGVAARTLNATVPPGGRRYFAITVPQPPAGIATVEISFDKAPKPPAEHGPAHETPHAEPPTTPAVVEAQPLPAGSPDALAPHAEH